MDLPGEYDSVDGRGACGYVGGGSWTIGSSSVLVGDIHAEEYEYYLSTIPAARAILRRSRTTAVIVSGLAGGTTFYARQILICHDS